MLRELKRTHLFSLFLLFFLHCAFSSLPQHSNLHAHFYMHTWNTQPAPLLGMSTPTHTNAHAQIFTFPPASTSRPGMSLSPTPTFSVPTYFCSAMRERLERYLKLSSLIISRIPQDTLCDVMEEGMGGRGVGAEGGRAWTEAMSHISHILSKGSGGTPSDTVGMSERRETAVFF